MRIGGSRPRLAVYVAPKVDFFGLFSKALEARLVLTLRGDVRVHVFARDRLARVALRSLGRPAAKNCFLLVTTRCFFDVSGLARPAGRGALMSGASCGSGTHMRRTRPARIATRFACFPGT